MYTFSNRSFATEQQLIDHEKIHIEGKQKFVCEHCNKQFTLKHRLVEHERIHTGVKPYSCNLCDKSFTHKSTLVTHERTHTGEKPYSCRHCDKSFATSSKLIVHERIHTGERPYSCKICNKSFVRSDGLKKHEKSCGKVKVDMSLVKEEELGTNILIKQEIFEESENFDFHQEFGTTSSENPPLFNNSEKDRLSHFKKFIKEEIKEEEMEANENCHDSDAEIDSQDSQIIDCGQFLNQELKEEDTK